VRRLCAVAFVFLAACGSEPPPPPIQVLASIEVEDPLAEQLADFTDETGTPVVVTWGDSTAQVDRLINKSGEPVDVIVTSNVAAIWRAADRGALRPIESALLDAQPAYLRDPDDYWGALNARFHAIFHRDNTHPVVASVQDLGDAEFAGKVCLSSSSLPVNRALVAYLVEAQGVREAERLVRRWVRNLAHPPFISELELLEAVRDGTCAYGIASWDVPETLQGVVPFLSQPMTADITAIGVNRHAAHPAAAQRLVDWLLRERARKFDLAQDYSPAPVRIAGWRDEEVRLLVERAGYR
jgi:iron(III) transport system substrate-binding protein